MILDFIISAALVYFGLREYSYAKKAAQDGYHPLWVAVGWLQVGLLLAAIPAVWS